MVSFMFRHLFH